MGILLAGDNEVLLGAHYLYQVAGMYRHCVYTIPALEEKPGITKLAASQAEIDPNALVQPK